MKTRNDHPNDQSNNNIGRKLREEALAGSPGFSPLLHARIMQQIQPATSAAQPHSPWRIGWRIPGSIAAVALLALTVWIFNHGQIKAKVAVGPAKPPAIPQVVIEFPNLSEPANSPLSLAHYGNLDRDAKAAATYVINQFDIVPTPPARRG